MKLKINANVAGCFILKTFSFILSMLILQKVSICLTVNFRNKNYVYNASVIHFFITIFYYTFFYCKFFVIFLTMGGVGGWGICNEV